MLKNNELQKKSENTEMDKKAEQNVEVRVAQVQPAVDIEEAKEDFIVNVDMPGIDPKDIQVNLDKEILTVEAKAEIEGLPPRHYYRQFRVMRGLDASKCRADYKLGVLTLKLAKPTTAQPKQIKITSE